MRSLFAKILLWFLAVMAIAVFGFLIVAASALHATRGRESFIDRMLDFQAEEARHAYEQGGRQGLANYLERWRHAFQARGVLTDAQGRDLLTGESRRALVDRAGKWPRPIFRASVLARQTDDGRYWFFLIAPATRRGFSLILPQYLWVVGVVALLSYLLALHLTSPLRRLERAVERFGRGDFSARVRSTRRDELGQLADAFDQMADRLETLLAAERRLLLDISHEIRSPLARLGVAVELARTGEDREAALDRIAKEADRLNDLVGELLQVTRAEGDPASMHREPVRLDELLGEIASDAAIEAEARQRRIEWKAGAPVQIQGDARLLRRAVENVVRNAIRHAPEGTAVEIALSGAQIAVRDYGPGVPEQDLARIFDPFYRVETDRNRASGGVGLGLAIARRAVELHKGRIQARNANPGLLVEIELPSTPA